MYIVKTNTELDLSLDHLNRCIWIKAAVDSPIHGFLCIHLIKKITSLVESKLFSSCYIILYYTCNIQKEGFSLLPAVYRLIRLTQSTVTRLIRIIGNNYVEHNI